MRLADHFCSIPGATNLLNLFPENESLRPYSVLLIRVTQSIIDAIDTLGTFMFFKWSLVGHSTDRSFRDLVLTELPIMMIFPWSLTNPQILPVATRQKHLIMDSEMKSGFPEVVGETSSVATMHNKSTLSTVMDSVGWVQGESQTQTASAFLEVAEDVDPASLEMAMWNFKEQSEPTPDAFSLDVGMMTAALGTTDQQHSMQSDFMTDSRSSTPLSVKRGGRSKKREDSDEDPDKEPLTVELQQGYRILRQIMADTNKSVNWPFMDPVKAEDGAFDYYERVEKPIWLRKSEFILLLQA